MNAIFIFFQIFFSEFYYNDSLLFINDFSLNIVKTNLPNMKDTTYYIADKMPSFCECKSIPKEPLRRKCSDDSYYKYLNENKIYPKEARKNKIKGNVVVQFVISSEGTIKNIKFIKKLGYGIEEELEKIISIPYSNNYFWESGEIAGKKVNVLKSYNLKFGTDDFGFITEVIPFKQDSLFTINDVDELPVFKSCTSQNNSHLQQFCSKTIFLELIYKNLKFPRDMTEYKNSGYAKVMFIISKNGNLESYKIINFSNKSYETAATEVMEKIIKLNPEWIPAKIDSQNVNLVMELPIKFQHLGMFNSY